MRMIYMEKNKRCNLKVGGTDTKSPREEFTRWMAYFTVTENVIILFEYIFRPFLLYAISAPNKEATFLTLIVINGKRK